MKVNYASRLNEIPPYLFTELERLKAEKKNQGIDIISLGIGDPDIPTPSFILETLANQALLETNHNYPSSEGELFFREAVVEWMNKRFGVELDAGKHVCCLSGSKEGLANVARAFVNPGDFVLVPNPAYPVYANGAAILCDGRVYSMPLFEENSFLPELNEVPKEVIESAKMIYLNYPNNPTGAVAEKKDLKKFVEFALENNLILCYDNAYSEFTFDEFIAPSILEIPDSMECSIEFHSFSKTFCMTGDRCGFAVGNEEIVGGLKKIKSNIDSGCPTYIQRAGVEALSSYKSREKPFEVKRIMKEYEERRNVLVNGLNEIGVPCSKPKATFYLWVRFPGGNSMEFARKLLEVGVVVTPGIGFGKHGEGFIRFALTQPKERIKEAIERIARVI